MSDHFQTFTQMKRFVGFNDEDATRLVAAAPIFAAQGAAITDRFYDVLATLPDAAKLLEGRVDHLKSTHGQWMHELFGGQYEQAYFDRRYRIGKVHVQVGVPPRYVEAVMNIIRTGGIAALHGALPTDEALAASHSLIKLLDLDLMVINLAYSEERIERLTAFTGFSRTLLERCIHRGAGQSA